MTPGPGIEPRPHWWEASALTTAPQFPQFKASSRVSVGFVYGSCGQTHMARSMGLDHEY